MYGWCEFLNEEARKKQFLALQLSRLFASSLPYLQNVLEQPLISTHGPKPHKQHVEHRLSLPKGLAPFETLPKKLLGFVDAVSGEDTEVLVCFTLFLFLLLFEFVQLGLGGLPGAFVGLAGGRGGRKGE